MERESTMERHRCSPRRRRTGRAGGFTLVELLVSAAIFMVGMAGVFALQLGAAGAGRDSLDLGSATSLASSRLELLRLVDIATLDSGSEYFDVSGSSLGVGGPAPANTYYTVSWTVAGTPLRTIGVDVSWRRSLRDHSVHLETQRAR
jgi:Tfp pilus assembly protein PilV